MIFRHYSECSNIVNDIEHTFDNVKFLSEVKFLFEGLQSCIRHLESFEWTVRQDLEISKVFCPPEAAQVQLR